MTYEEAHRLFMYDPETGIFIHKIGVHSGKEAGTKSGRGYISLSANRIRYKAHRVAWLMSTGEWPEQQIDHINRNSSDNRLSNLREVSGVGNNRNKSLYSNNSTRVTGVFWEKDREKWEACIRIEGRRMNLGRYSCLLDAVAARLRAERQYGFHENHGRTVCTQ